MQTGTCEKKTQVLLSVPQSTVVQSEPADRPCDGTGEVRCAKRDTCCRISASQWACCPSPKVRPHQRFLFDDVMRGGSRVRTVVSAVSHDCSRYVAVGSALNRGSAKFTSL